MKYEVERQEIDNETFLQLRELTDNVVKFLDKRLIRHLDTVKPLFTVNKLFGTYIKSSVQDDVAGSDKAFAELQQLFSSVCEAPFGITKKLNPPLPSMNNKLSAHKYQYDLTIDSSKAKKVITSPVRWTISYSGDCSLQRINNMVNGEENINVEEIKQTILNHLILVVYLNNHNEFIQLFEDLSYKVDIVKLAYLGNLPVVTLRAPLKTVLPTNDFIEKVTQFSGIPAFQEIIKKDAIEAFSDPLKESFKKIINE